MVRVQAIKERAALEIIFPRVEGYRVELPEERLQATFTEDSRLFLTPEEVGPCKVLLEGIVGEGVEIGPDVLNDMRPSTISFHLAKHLMYTRFRDHGEEPPLHLFGQIKRIARRWIDEGYLVVQGRHRAGHGHLPRDGREGGRTDLSCLPAHGAWRRSASRQSSTPTIPRARPATSASSTSKTTYRTSPAKCHVNYVVCDSDWEAELRACWRAIRRVRAYVKNQGLQFEVPYRDGGVPRKYIPDFIVQVDDGQDDPLNLVLETKGYRGGDAQVKAETMRTLWVPGVNNLGTFGRWRFEEFTDVFEIEAAFARLLDGLGEKADA